MTLPGCFFPLNMISLGNQDRFTAVIKNIHIIICRRPAEFVPISGESVLSRLFQAELQNEKMVTLVTVFADKKCMIVVVCVPEIFYNKG